MAKITFLFKRLFLLLIGVVVLFIVALALFFSFAPQIGQTPTGNHLERISTSEQFSDGVFVNNVPTSLGNPLDITLKAGIRYFTNTEAREPQEVIKTVPFDREKIITMGEEEVGITWFGHSTALIRIEGYTLLADPVFGPRASMFSFAGPEQFDYDPRATLDDLPPIDAVIISHDHYDHLDYFAISILKDRVKRFFVPLGVGAHLMLWGVPEQNITELDWWEEAVFSDQLTLVATPSRHFSGRGLTSRNGTLWASWSIIGRSRRVFFSGDSGYFPGFKKIGDKYGPFDFVMMECGAYNELWADIHMMPEESAQAFKDVRGKVLMPIHWGKFNLALHPWKEPVQRLHAAMDGDERIIAQPEVGQVFYIDRNVPTAKWWEQYE